MTSLSRFCFDTARAKGCVAQPYLGLSELTTIHNLLQHCQANNSKLYVAAGKTGSSHSHKRKSRKSDVSEAGEDADENGMSDKVNLQVNNWLTAEFPQKFPDKLIASVEYQGIHRKTPVGKQVWLDQVELRIF